MRTGRDDEKISLPINIDKPWMKRAVFLDFSAHLLITAFANSHLKVLRQCNAVIIRAFEISKASQGFLHGLSILQAGEIYGCP